MHFTTNVCLAGYFATYASAAALTSRAVKPPICLLGVPILDTSYTTLPAPFAINVQLKNFTGDALPVKYDALPSSKQQAVTVGTVDAKPMIFKLTNGILTIDQKNPRQIRNGVTLEETNDTKNTNNDGKILTVEWKAQYVCNGETPVLSLIPTNQEGSKSTPRQSLQILDHAP